MTLIFSHLVCFGAGLPGSRAVSSTAACVERTTASPEGTTLSLDRGLRDLCRLWTARSVLFSDWLLQSHAELASPPGRACAKLCIVLLLDLRRYRNLDTLTFKIKEDIDQFVL